MSEERIVVLYHSEVTDVGGKVHAVFTEQKEHALLNGISYPSICCRMSPTKARKEVNMEVNCLHCLAFLNAALGTTRYYAWQMRGKRLIDVLAPVHCAGCGVELPPDKKQFMQPVGMGFVHWHVYCHEKANEEMARRRKWKASGEVEGGQEGLQENQRGDTGCKLMVSSMGGGLPVGDYRLPEEQETPQVRDDKSFVVLDSDGSSTSYASGEDWYKDYAKAAAIADKAWQERQRRRQVVAAYFFLCFIIGLFLGHTAAIVAKIWGF